jgi:hypothetical protein
MNNGLLILLGLALLAYKFGGDDDEDVLRAAARKGQKAYHVDYTSAGAEELDDEDIVAPNKTAAIAQMKQRLLKEGVDIRGARFEAEEIEGD